MKKVIKYYKSLTIGKRTLLSFLLYIFSGLLFGLLSGFNPAFHILFKFGIIVSSLFGLLFFFNFIILIFHYLKKIFKSKYRLHILIIVSSAVLFFVYYYKFSNNINECNNIVDNNKKQECELNTKLCNSNDTQGCISLGTIYTESKEIKQNYTKASKLYAKACNQNDDKGCLLLAFMHTDGKGVDKNISKTINLYTKVCNNDNALGCYLLGTLYNNHGSNDIKQDNAKAVKFYTKACYNSPATDGCYMAGTMYLRGDEVEQDSLKAIDLLKKSCSDGSSLGCMTMGIIYEGEHNYNEAMKFYSNACDIKDEHSDKGCILRDAVNEKLKKNKPRKSVLQLMYENSQRRINEEMGISNR